MVVACSALFVALGGTALTTTYVVSSNSQIGLGTVSGHKPPSGDHANIIGGSINGSDIASGSVTAAKLQAPEAWHTVGPASSSQDRCADASHTGVFCSPDVFGPYPWRNYGGGYATAAFYRDQLGIVHLKGLVSGPNGINFTQPKTLPIFRLPPGYAPATTRVFASEGRNAGGQEVSQARVDVQPNGLVVFEQDCEPSGADCSADGEHVTLDGISFRRDG
jgi:hypothetical protein